MMMVWFTVKLSTLHSQCHFSVLHSTSGTITNEFRPPAGLGICPGRGDLRQLATDHTLSRERHPHCPAETPCVLATSTWRPRRGPQQAAGLPSHSSPLCHSHSNREKTARKASRRKTAMYSPLISLFHDALLCWSLKLD